MSYRFLGNLFLTTVFTMVCIYVVKYIGKTYEVPILKEISEGV